MLPLFLLVLCLLHNLSIQRDEIDVEWILDVLQEEIAVVAQDSLTQKYVVAIAKIENFGEFFCVEVNMES
jgi:hypothetical protein